MKKHEGEDSDEGSMSKRSKVEAGEGVNKLPDNRALKKQIAQQTKKLEKMEDEVDEGTARVKATTLEIMIAMGQNEALYREVVNRALAKSTIISTINHINLSNRAASTNPINRVTGYQ